MLQLYDEDYVPSTVPLQSPELLIRHVADQCVNTSACNRNGWLASFWVLLKKNPVQCSQAISDNSNKCIHDVPFTQEIQISL